MKVVINRCYGGFGISEAAQALLKKRFKRTRDFYPDDDRGDPHLVKVVEELGKRANGDCAELKVVEIPDGVQYTIEEYDGIEWVAEKHRTWR